MKLFKNPKIYILSFLLAFVAITNIAYAQQNPNVKPRTAEENCNVFYKWFTIPQKNTGETNAVENLPYFCTAQGLILWVMNGLLLLAGSVAVIFIIIGGFRYVTSAGNEENSEKAKKTLVT